MTAEKLFTVRDECLDQMREKAKDWRDLETGDDPVRMFQDVSTMLLASLQIFARLAGAVIDYENTCIEEYPDW